MEPRNDIVRFRATSREKAEMFRWAKKCGKTVSDYLRHLHKNNKQRYKFSGGSYK